MCTAALNQAIEDFCSLPIASVGSELARDLKELALARNRLDLRFSELAAAFGGTDQFDREGFISPIHWIRVNCNMTASAAADRVIVGEQVAAVRASVEAMKTDEIGFSHLALIAREAEAKSDSGRYDTFDESRLLNKARAYTVGRFRNFCHHERHANDPDGYATEASEAAQARTLSLATGEGGMLWIRGVLDPEGGAVLRSALEPLAKRTGNGDLRRKDQRLGDAVVELAAHVLDAGTLPRQGAKGRTCK